MVPSGPLGPTCRSAPSGRLEDVRVADGPGTDDVGQAVGGAFDLATSCPAPQLLGKFPDLGEAGGPGGVTAPDEPAVGRGRPAAPKLGGAVMNEPVAFARPAEADLLVVKEFLDGVGVVERQDSQVVWAEARLLVGRERGPVGHLGGPDDGPGEEVPVDVTLRVGLGGGDPHCWGTADPAQCSL